MLNVRHDVDMFGHEGVAALVGISYGYDPKSCVAAILKDKGRCAFYVTADAQYKDVKETTAKKMQKIFEENKLGVMYETEGWHYNEAHGPRYIKIYVVVPDWDSPNIESFLNGKDIKEKQDMNKW